MMFQCFAFIIFKLLSFKNLKLLVFFESTESFLWLRLLRHLPLAPQIPALLGRGQVPATEAEPLVTP